MLPRHLLASPRRCPAGGSGPPSPSCPGQARQGDPATQAMGSCFRASAVEGGPWLSWRATLHLGYMPCYFALAWLPGASRNQLCSRQVQFWRPSTTPAWHGTATALPSTTPRRRPLTPPFNPARRFSHLQSLVSSSASSVLRPVFSVQRPAFCVQHFFVASPQL